MVQLKFIPRGNEDESETEEDASPDSHSHEPEPEEHIDLLDDDVDGEDAETVMVLDGSRRSILVERALGHLGEHLGHGINTVLHLHVGNAENIPSIRGELSTKEGVHEVHLANNVDEVEDLTEDKLVNVDVMGSDGPGDPVDDDRAAILSSVFFDHGSVEVLDEHADLSSLPRLPDEVRDVAHDGLCEQNEADPLVPGVPDLITVIVGGNVAGIVVRSSTRTNARVGEILALGTSELFWQSECSMDPAVCIEHIGRDCLSDAGDGISKELSSSGEETTGSKNHKSHLVMKAKCCVVNQTSFGSDPLRDRSEKTQHGQKQSIKEKAKRCCLFVR